MHMKRESIFGANETKNWQQQHIWYIDSLYNSPHSKRNTYTLTHNIGIYEYKYELIYLIEWNESNICLSYLISLWFFQFYFFASAICDTWYMHISVQRCVCVCVYVDMMAMEEIKDRYGGGAE